MSQAAFLMVFIKSFSDIVAPMAFWSTVGAIPCSEFNVKPRSDTTTSIPMTDAVNVKTTVPGLYVVEQENQKQEKSKKKNEEKHDNIIFKNKSIGNSKKNGI